MHVRANLINPPCVHSSNFARVFVMLHKQTVAGNERLIYDGPSICCPDFDVFESKWTKAINLGISVSSITLTLRSALEPQVFSILARLMNIERQKL